MEYHLSNFDGPLDLLLHLIAKSKVAIKDIFVSQITEQYLEYMRGIPALDMDAASDFLQMAATLVYIKSRTLLPNAADDEETDEQGMTSEEQLIARLKEYKRYKEAAAAMRELEAAGKGYYYKLPEELTRESDEAEFLNATANALYIAYAKLLLKKQAAVVAPRSVNISADRFTVKKQSQLIMARLTIHPEATFFSFFTDETTAEERAVTFIALLELVNAGRILISQKKYLGDIKIRSAA